VTDTRGVDEVCAAIWQAVGVACEHKDLAFSSSDDWEVVMTDNWKTVVLVTADHKFHLFHPGGSNLLRNPEDYPIALLVEAIQDIRKKEPGLTDVSAELMKLIRFSAATLEEIYGAKGLEALSDTLEVSTTWLRDVLVSETQG
jgi:hypothetical protein